MSLRVALLLAACLGLCAQEPAPQKPEAAASSAQSIQQLFEAERWPEVVARIEAEASPHPSAELEYYYGVALAHLNRLEDSRKALLTGQRMQPGDKRFPLELAGVAFRQKQYSEATSRLHRALRLDPHDAYASEFLATVYFLQGNLEAATKYWNRSDKPFIEEVRIPPALRVDRALLDHAFAFAPASRLKSADLAATEARLRALEIFPGFRLDLSARPDGKFDASLSAQERNGWGKTPLEGLFRVFRGLPWQQVQPEYFNIGGMAVNFESLARWNAEKRRAYASLSSPIRRNPQWRFRVTADARSENWDVRNPFIDAWPVLESLNLRRAEAGIEITRLVGGRLAWTSATRVSRRYYRDTAGNALSSDLLASGYQLAQSARLRYDLLRIPEKRFNVSSEFSATAGRLWSNPAQSFEKLQASLTLHWFPRAHGDDFETTLRLQAGKLWGDPPFDELFIAGLERETNLLLRGHAGSRRGRKGSSPIGRNYVLANWEIDKNLYSNGVVRFKLGPFVDTGRVGDGLFPGTNQWLWDTGAQLKISVFGVSAVLSYGRDLRAGRNVLYAGAGR